MSNEIEMAGTPIVHGGGWITRETIGRPKARFFGFLSLAWLPLSVVATILLSFLEDKRLTWICVLLLILQAGFIVIAFILRICEKPKKITVIQDK